MNFVALTLAAALAAVPSTSDERPLWAGPLRLGGDVIVVSAVPAGIGVRSASASVMMGGDASAALGAGLCGGASPRLGIPAGASLYLLGPGSPASLVAVASLPAQAISAAVPVEDSSGCRLAVALQNGDVALVGPSGAIQGLSAVIPAAKDWHELPRGVLIAASRDLLVVGGVDGSVSGVRLGDGKRFAGSIGPAAVPGAVWSDVDGSLWFLGKTGSLVAWPVTSGPPQVLRTGTVGAPGGLVAWGGRSDHGIAWADMEGQVWAWKGNATRALVRLPAAVRWPMLVADLDGTGDLKLVAPVDGQVAALVTEEAAGASYQAMPIAGRPAGSPVAYQLDLDHPSVLAIPAGPTSAAFHPADEASSSHLVHDQAILVTGSQISGLVPGPVQASLVVPPGSGSGGSGGAGGSGGSGSGAGSGQASTRSGFGCSTAPSSDALPLLLAPAFLLLRRRRPGAAG